MNNNLKLVLSVLCFIFIIIVVYVILIIKGILSNPFLDTKDLVCRVDNFYPDGTDLVVTFRFDKKAMIKSYTESYVYFIEDENELNELKYDLEKNNEEFTINGNEVTIYINFFIERDKGYYGKTKSPSVLRKGFFM